MKLQFGLFCMALLIMNCFAGQAQSNGMYAYSTSSSGSPARQLASSGEAEDIIEEIIKVLGLKPNFEVRVANVPNAAAVAHQGKRFVLYNPDFIYTLNKAAGNQWASISVLAHEIGHHLNGHTLEAIGSQPDKELEADEFSGFVLRRMGATLPQAQSAMKIAADYKKSLTHPGKEDRLVAIAGGWKNADEQITGKQDIIKNLSEKAAIQTGSSVTTGQALLAEKDIIGDVQFTQDVRSKYFVTTRFNIVKVVNNQLHVVGKLAPLENDSYPYIIYDDNTRLFVDSRGNIVSGNGKPVGYLKARRS